MQVTNNKTGVSENTVSALAYGYDKEVEPVDGSNPLTELLAKEQRESLDLGEEEERAIKIEAVSGVLSYLFEPINGRMPNPLDVVQRLYLLCYQIRPVLIESWSLEKIAKCFDSTRQVFSKRLIKANERLGGLRVRTQKSDRAVSVYREGTTQYHAEKKANEKRARRKAYMRAYKAARKREDAAYQKLYYARNKNRILAQQQKRRSRT